MRTDETTEVTEGYSVFPIAFGTVVGFDYVLLITGK
jgi:hypothetical protein